MAKSNLQEAARILAHYIEVAYNRQGTGPQLEPEMRGELGMVISMFGHLDDYFNRQSAYPPIEEPELVDSRAYEGIFDRIVVAQNGIYGRRVGSADWVRLRSIAEQARIDAAKEAKELAAQAAREAEAAAKTPVTPA